MSDCLAPRHDEPEPAMAAARLCRPCASGLRRDLKRLPVLYAGLADLLRPSRGGDGGGSGDGLPYNDAAAEAMSQVRHDLAVWTRQVIADRQPAAWPLLTVPAMAGWLSGWAEWIPVRAWAGDMAGALASDRGRAVALLDPRPVSRRPFRRSPCPRCGGDLVTVLYGDGDPRTPAIGCARCEHEWEFGQAWQALEREITRAAHRRAVA